MMYTLPFWGVMCFSVNVGAGGKCWVHAAFRNLRDGIPEMLAPGQSFVREVRLYNSAVAECRTVVVVVLVVVHPQIGPYVAQSTARVSHLPNMFSTTTIVIATPLVGCTCALLYHS